MQLSVIIVNYNVRQFLENALTAIQKAMKGIEGEIIVVDNASDDGSVEMLKAKFPGVILIENKENVGFARANNTALRIARSQFLLLINPDTVVQEDTLHVMLNFFRENADVGLAGCKILNPDGSFQLGCRRSFPTPWVAFTKIIGLSNLFPRSKLFGRYNLTFLSPDETYEVEAVSGSFMMVRREAYEGAGGLDEKFFMYGEDLDWCYSVAKAGFKVYYVPLTKIVHFKGESTRRSEIDEVRLFYKAMQLFVEKHFSSSIVIRFFLMVGILVRGAVASLGKSARPILFGLIDIAFVQCALVLSEYLYFRRIFHLPEYAYPTVWIVPAGIVVSTLYFAGAYTIQRYSSARAALSVMISYIIISASVFFAKDFAFSRAMVIIAGVISIVAIPGWRFVFSRYRRAGSPGVARGGLFGRRTVIVGTGSSAREVLKKLRARVDDGYDVLGFIDMDRKHIGEKISGVEIIGSIDNVGKVIGERKVSEVIFSTDGLTYTDILSVIGRSTVRNVNFRLVPNSLEAIIGKTRIDQLDNIPLVEIDYRIHRPGNRFAKRLFDLVCSGCLLACVYPLLKLRMVLRRGESPGGIARDILLLPQVFSGKLSMVGRPISDNDTPVPVNGRGKLGSRAQASYLGPRGLTGLVQINERADLTQDEIDRYKVYYAKNQSLILDCEIILKSLLLSFKGGGRNIHG